MGGWWWWYVSVCGQVCDDNQRHGQVVCVYVQECCHSFSSKEQASFNFMAAVTVHGDFGAKEIKSVTISIFCPPISHEVMRPNAMISVF